jgi:hypothetical protein
MRIHSQQGVVLPGRAERGFGGLPVSSESMTGKAARILMLLDLL